MTQEPRIIYTISSLGSEPTHYEVVTDLNSQVISISEGIKEESIEYVNNKIGLWWFLRRYSNPYWEISSRVEPQVPLLTGITAPPPPSIWDQK